MGIKEKWQKRIEKNAFKSTLTWRKNKGTKKKPRIVEYTEEVYFKRSVFPLIGDWIRIHPPIREDGSVHWTNLFFGGYKNLIKLLFIGGLIALILLGFGETFNYINIIESNPCFQSCISNTVTVLP